MKIEKLIKRGLSKAGQISGIQERSFDNGDAERFRNSELSAEEDASLIAASSSDELKGRERRGSFMFQELKRQSGVFFDDPMTDYDTDRSVNGGATEAVESDEIIEKVFYE